MKKFFILTAIACLFAVCTLQAQEAKAQPSQENDYEFFSLTVCPGVSTAPDSVDVYGFRIGAPVAFGNDSFVAGIELSILAGMSNEVYGLQAAPILSVPIMSKESSSRWSTSSRRFTVFSSAL